MNRDSSPTTKPNCSTLFVIHRYPSLSFTVYKWVNRRPLPVIQFLICGSCILSLILKTLLFSSDLTATTKSFLAYFGSQWIIKQRYCFAGIHWCWKLRVYSFNWSTPVILFKVPMQQLEHNAKSELPEVPGGVTNSWVCTTYIHRC